MKKYTPFIVFGLVVSFIIFAVIYLSKEIPANPMDFSVPNTKKVESKITPLNDPWCLDNPDQCKG